MKEILIIVFCFSSFFGFGQNCQMLKDGKYQIQYDHINRDSAIIEISRNNYYELKKQQKIKSEIIKLNNCSFRLKPLAIIDESNFTEFQKMLDKQKPYFEITKVEGNTYYFIRRVDLHIQCGTGKFVKIE